MPHEDGVMMRLGPCRKMYRAETQRAVPLEETLKRAEQMLPAAGVTRVADITQLDRVGIPVYSCIRPTAEMGAISVYNGKGATKLAAKVSAMMEGIERYSAELKGRKLFVQSFSKMGKEGDAINPASLILPQGRHPDLPVPWVEGFDICTGEPVFVPAHAVFHPVPRDLPPLFRTNTNGLASGNTYEEAVFHALTEVIERDAWSIVEATRQTGRSIEIPENGMIGDLARRFGEAGIDIRLKDITSDIGIPTVAAVADDLVLRDPALLTIGMGTHTEAAIAAIRALTEVAQSRLTQIHGAREDTTTAEFRKQLGYERTKRMNRHWFADNGSMDLGALPTFSSEDFLDDIHYMVKQLAGKGLHRVIAVDLTRPEIGIPVVRVVVPGLEVYAIDSERIGDRCRDARRRHISGPKPSR
ncbi:MAG: YcaO-related McrA-glycine thioamidation protein [Methanomicrobiales archaeon]|nr:YcaO-related McrA-glycine thioamidation protein [Methanomicrobiales archaeon]